MARITVEDCLEVVNNRFELVMMASKRARQLANGVQATIDNSESEDKPTVLALREIAARRIDNELIEEAGGFVQEPAKIISGGPMMGFGIFDLNVPTTKTSSALLCLTHDDVADSQPSACINCGRCVEVCPGRVVPKLLADYAERHDLERFEACNGLECCECGCCSYVCPAKRPLTQAIKSARKMVLAEKKKKQQEAKK